MWAVSMATRNMSSSSVENMKGVGSAQPVLYWNGSNPSTPYVLVVSMSWLVSRPDISSLIPFENASTAVTLPERKLRAKARRPPSVV